MQKVAIMRRCGEGVASCARESWSVKCGASVGGVSRRTGVCAALQSGEKSDDDDDEEAIVSFRVPLSAEKTSGTATYGATAAEVAYDVDDDDYDDEFDDADEHVTRRRGGKMEEEILFDIDHGWQLSPRAHQLLGDESKYAIDADSRVPNVKIGGIELPGSLLAMLEEEAARAERAEERRAKSSDKNRNAMKRKTWRGLRVVGGSSSGARLYSAKDNDLTRPMMEKVRLALFSMLESLLCASSASSGLSLPTTSRWLDLYAGTGSVGIEALSRGVGSAHFVELDSWTVREVLRKNIDVVNGHDRATVHVMRVR